MRAKRAHAEQIATELKAGNLCTTVRAEYGCTSGTATDCTQGMARFTHAEHITTATYGAPVAEYARSGQHLRVMLDRATKRTQIAECAGGKSDVTG